MSMFEQMHKVVPESELGVAKVDHFEVDKEAAMGTAFSAMANGDIGRMVTAGRYTRLHVGNVLMMTDTDMEKRSNYGVVTAAKGNVLIAGLGIGMVLVPILRKKEVISVEVVEKHEDVIRLIEPALRAHVPEANHKLTTICADIHTWKPPKNKKWDTIYFDIWPTIDQDNLEEINQLHRRFAQRKPKDGWMSSWQVARLRAERRRDVRSY